MRPDNLFSRIFLDGGDPEETARICERLGFLDGQTTNPTLIAKSPQAQARLSRGEKFTQEEIYAFYKTVVSQISRLVMQGSVSVEVYADASTPVDTMIAQGKEMFSWIPNAHVKYPTTPNGLEAASRCVAEGMRVNMTLVFSQSQAAAVYAATRGAKKGDVFISPFVGRLDDRGENGMDLIKHIVRMYAYGDGHVEVLTASVRTLDHFLYALALRSDIITAPVSVLEAWSDAGMPIPGSEYVYNASGRTPIPYCDYDLLAPVDSYDINHELTANGIERFARDWNALLKEEDG